MNESSWRLRIRAIDGGWPYPRSSQMILTIYINGTNVPSKIRPALSRDPPNENTPKFENLPSMIRVNEDADIGSVGVLIRLAYFSIYKSLKMSYFFVSSITHL